MKDDQRLDWQGCKLSRRTLLRAGTGAAIGSLGLAAVGCGKDDEEESAVAGSTAQPTSGVISPVDQQKWRRIRTGLTAWDPTKTYDGYTLFCSNMNQREVYLIDMDGNLAHKWELDLPPEQQGFAWAPCFMPNGNLFHSIHVPSTQAPMMVFVGGLLMEIDWDGNIVWQLEQPAQHHDTCLLPNGNILVLNNEIAPPEVAAKVQGGMPGQSEDTWSDWVAEVTREGEVVWEWHAWEHLDPEIDIMNACDTREEWTHGNSVEQMPDGNILISFRNINTVAIIERSTGDVIWRLGPPVLAQQHHPSCLDNGNILIFDNGAHRLDMSVPYSSVIEVDPKTSEVVWEYTDRNMFDFFSPFISGAQRLPNGNTLITEGNFGRLFEVTTEKEIVWEYINPFIAQHEMLGENNWVFRAYRYAAEEIPNLKA